MVKILATCAGKMDFAQRQAYAELRTVDCHDRREERL